MQQRGIVHPSLYATVIAQNDASIVFTVPASVASNGTVTPETNLAAQTVRVSMDNRALTAQSEAGIAPKLIARVYAATGVDIAEGYRFTHEGNRFRVVDILPAPGGIQAVAEGLG